MSLCSVFCVGANIQCLICSCDETVAETFEIAWRSLEHHLCSISSTRLYSGINLGGGFGVLGVSTRGLRVMESLQEATGSPGQKFVF